MATTFQKYLVMSFGYEHLVGLVGFDGMDRVEKEIKDYNLYSVLETCAKISITLLHRGITNPLGQAELLNGIFPDKAQRIKFYETARAISAGSPWAIFNHQSVLTLAKLALINCPYKGGKSVTNEDVEKLGYWLLHINDKCFSEETHRGIELPSREHERERLREALARYQFFHTSERLPYRIGRYRWIVKYFRRHVPHEIDLDDLFEKATGISLEDYMAVCASLLVKWVNLSSKKKDGADLSNWVTCTEAYFRETKLEPEIVDKVLDLISMLPQEFKRHYEDSVDLVLKGNEQFHYNFLPFAWRPLIWFQDKKCFICPSTSFLFDKASEGIYRNIETYLRESKQEKLRQTFSIAWGYAFEEYIGKSLSNAFGENYYLNPEDEKGVEMIDGILDSSSFVFLFETKSLHWPYSTMVTGKLSDEDSPIKQLFTEKGLVQIRNLLDKYNNGEWELPVDPKGKKFVPVLVVSESMPYDTYNRKLYEEYADQVSSFVRKTGVLPFIILNAEEVEILESIALQCGKEEAIQILSEYSHLFILRNDLGFVPDAISFKNYLYEKGYEGRRDGKQLNNERIMSYFDDVMEDLAMRAFGHKLEKRRDVSQKK